MKQRLQVFLISLFVFAVSFSISAKKITLDDAKHMAENVFMMQSLTNASFKAENVQLSSSFVKVDEHTNETSCYIFNFEPTGFVILSAEDNYNAVLAFSSESNIDVHDDERNIGLWGHLSVHEQRIDYIKRSGIKASAKINNEWKKIRSMDSKSAKNLQQFDIVVPPLTTTKWDQGIYFNAFCPADAEAGQDGKVWGGCVPIAMAQLIKYYNYPTKGNGNNSFSDARYGSLSADFCGSNYNWANMPDELTTYNDDVAQLIYHMGVATNTEYSPTYTKTYWSYVRNTFVDYFNFDHEAKVFDDSTNEYFAEIAKRNLDEAHPVILTGDDLATGWGHCWVADGYGYFDTSQGTGQEYFHFNWGWRGDNNGWFLDSGSDWKTLEDQPETFDVTYYWNRSVLYDVFPAETQCQAPGEYYTSALKETSTFINYHNYNLDEQIQFRYREIGTTIWTEFPVTQNYYSYVRNLAPSTEYEFQVRRDCCGGLWSDYSASQSFRTKGEGQSCNNVSVSAAPDFYALVGFDRDSHNLFQYYYNTDGFEYVYGFAEKCNPWAAVSYYDCNGNLLDVEVPRGSVITYLLENECEVVEPDCARNSGTFFYDLCDNGERYYFLRDDDGTVYDPYFPEGSNFTFVDGTKVNYDFTYMGFNTCSVANGGPIQLTCIEYQGDGGAIFQVYPWITDIVSPQNCNGETINLYDFGRYTFLTINEANGNRSLYLYNGTFYCSSESCIETYLSSAPVSDSWSCGQTTVTPPNPPEPPMPSNCATLSSDLLSSPASLTSIYLYAAQPMGAIPNQFRYRAVGTSDWMLSDISDLYYKVATGLVSGITYEFQLRHECSPGNWSDYTDSFSFTVGGGLVAKSDLAPMSLAQVTKLTDGSLNDLQVYPNPASTVLFVQVQNQLDNNTIKVYNIAGDLVKTVAVEANASIKSIEVNYLTAGMYFIEINQGNNLIHKKFIKE